MTSLNMRAFGGLLALLVVMAALVFVPAGTLDYWQAWTFLAVYFASSLAISLYLMKKDPALMERRMRGGPLAEKEPAQKIIMVLTSVGFIGLLVVPALDHRFGWSHVSPYAAVAGDVLLGLGWLAILFVFKENTFSSATIQLAPDQTAISTGPYALVRHPMYAGGLLMLPGMPGATVLRNLMEQRPDQRVLVLSAVPFVRAQAPAQTRGNSDPAEALAAALTAACSHDDAAFAGYLTAANSTVFRQSPVPQRIALMQRLVLLDDVGKPSASAGEQGRTVLRCEAAGDVTEMRFGAPETHDALAFKA